MTHYKAVVSEDIPRNRLLSIKKGEKLPKLVITDSGGVPDLMSTGELKQGQEVTVNINNSISFTVEAGEDLEAGSSVEVGKNGVVVSAGGSGFGYVVYDTKKGDVVEVVRRSGAGAGGKEGKQGKQGPKGFGTEKQYKDIIERLKKLEEKGD